MNRICIWNMKKTLFFFSSFAGLGDLIKTDDIMKADNYNQN